MTRKKTMPPTLLPPGPVAAALGHTSPHAMAALSTADMLPGVINSIILTVEGLLYVRRDLVPPPDLYEAALMCFPAEFRDVVRTGAIQDSSFGKGLDPDARTTAWNLAATLGPDTATDVRLHGVRTPEGREAWVEFLLDDATPIHVPHGGSVQLRMPPGHPMHGDMTAWVGARLAKVDLPNEAFINCLRTFFSEHGPAGVYAALHHDALGPIADEHLILRDRVRFMKDSVAPLVARRRAERVLSHLFAPHKEALSTALMLSSARSISTPLGPEIGLITR